MLVHPFLLLPALWLWFASCCCACAFCWLRVRERGPAFDLWECCAYAARVIPLYWVNETWAFVQFSQEYWLSVLSTFDCWISRLGIIWLYLLWYCTGVVLYITIIDMPDMHSCCTIYYLIIQFHILRPLRGVCLFLPVTVCHQSGNAWIASCHSSLCLRCSF